MATTYICKCGRMVTKSTNADTTGNRDTAGCEGCPYLLPWGPFVYKESVGYVMDVHGYECRMSKNIEYDTRFFGSVTDKCSCHIHSLDFDFLTRVIAWIRESNGELFASFSPDSVRPCEYMGDGRYRMSIGCAQNKKGIAAKTAFLEQFFGPDKHRLDMTPEQEKAHILAAIEAGKARARRKEKTMIYKDPVTGWMYRVSPKAGKDGCFCIEYIDPVSSAVWKPWPAEAKTRATSSETIAEVLEARVKQNGWEPVEEKEWKNPEKTAPSVNSAATMGESAAPVQLPKAEISIGCSEAKTGTASSSPSAEDVLSENEPSVIAQAAPTSAAPAFDYSGLDSGTAERLQNLARRAMEAKQRYVLDLMEIVVEAHRELCGSVVARCDNGTFGKKDDTFRAWCVSIGVSKDTAYRLLQVQSLMDGSTPEEQEVLAEAPANLLYAAAKPSAPAELVRAVKDGDITTHKQYQEAMAQLKAEREAREKAEQKAALAYEREEKARAVAHQYHVQYEEVNGQRNRLLDERGVYISRITEAEERAKAAEVAAQDAARTIQRKQEAIEELDEIARDRLAQIEALEKGRTIEAQVSDPEEVRRQAEALARELAATETAGLQEENRRLRSRAPAIRQAKILLVAVMAQVLRECDKLEADDEEGSDALIEFSGELLSWSADIKERVMAAAGYEEDGYDTDES